MPDRLAYRLRQCANRLLHPLGLHLTRASRAFEMDDLLRGVAQRGPRPATFLDVGASDGVWSRRARAHFPDATFVLFEPLAEHQAALNRFAREPRIHVVPAVATDREGTINFTVSPDLDGSGVTESGGRPVPATTIDATVTRLGLAPPFALKLDTHGHELAVLAGASETLPRTDLLIIEAYNFELHPGSPRFPALCAWLETRGFRCIDLADPLRRPSDGVLWQMDLAFAPANRPLFQSNRYR